MNVECVVYRCTKQDELYLYLRADLKPEALPEPLLKRAGTLHQVMTLSLNRERRLARVDVEKVMERLATEGWFLQLPPDGHMKGHLHFGD